MVGTTLIRPYMLDDPTPFLNHYGIYNDIIRLRRPFAHYRHHIYTCGITVLVHSMNIPTFIDEEM